MSLAKRGLSLSHNWELGLGCVGYTELQYYSAGGESNISIPLPTKSRKQTNNKIEGFPLQFCNVIETSETTGVFCHVFDRFEKDSISFIFRLQP